MRMDNEGNETTTNYGPIPTIFTIIATIIWLPILAIIATWATH